MNPQILTLTAIFALAFLTEALVEYFLRPLFKPAPPVAGCEEAGPAQPRLIAEEEENPPFRLFRPSQPWTPHPLILRYVAALVGVLLCILYRADLLLMIGLAPPWPIAGYIITGLIVGRGSNFVHDFADRWISPQPQA